MVSPENAAGEQVSNLALTELTCGAPCCSPESQVLELEGAWSSGPLIPQGGYPKPASQLLAELVLEPRL